MIFRLLSNEVSFAKEKEIYVCVYVWFVYIIIYFSFEGEFTLLGAGGG